MLLSGVWKERCGVWRQDHTTHSELCQEACQYLWCRLGECLQCFHHVLKRGLRVISSKGPGHSPGPCLPEDEGTVHNRLVWNFPHDLTNNWPHVNAMLIFNHIKMLKWRRYTELLEKQSSQMSHRWWKNGCYNAVTQTVLLNMIVGWCNVVTVSLVQKMLHSNVADPQWWISGWTKKQNTAVLDCICVVNLI